MKKSPCADCPKKGCGAYHDICPDYLEWSEGQKTNRRETNKVTTAKPHMERSKTFRASKNCNVLKGHKR